MKIRKILRRTFNLYNLAIVCCILVIIASLTVIFDIDFNSTVKTEKEMVEPAGNKETSLNESKEEKTTESNENKSTTSSENNSKKEEDSKKEDSEENTNKITKEKAITIALDKFKELGEKNVKEEDLSVKSLRRSGEEYYYISSKENTLEVKIDSGKITRINSIVVNE